jgi:hypothetical protein
MKASFCRSCGAEIWWLAHARTAKKAPIDVVPDEKGNVIVSLEDGQYQLATLTEGPGERFTNHFQTCVDAAKWKKPKERA